ncbi:hypothetical protein [Microbacterium xanthum]|uniref:hypothetical protein n=1 Tax=Microbacterium xanthum TaxID=3079794 RepID=UPI002AD52848|nr:hypothetical protein [Microbacterium sp. KSW-48]MDZ8171614.1 hypothetical protein [Microbacterium sp. KSW-48]
MLDVRTLSAVTGLGFEPTGDSGVDSGDSVVNVGGTNCSWRTETGEFLLVSVLPEWGIGQERLGREAADFYFGNCESDTWVCTAAGGDGELWIAVSGSGGVGAHDFDEFAPILMDDVATSWHAREERPWTRDTTEWAHALDCGELAERMSAASGVEITASAGDLYIDPPHAVFVLADQVSRASGCTFEGEGLWADIVSRAGTGWSVADGASDRDEINIGRVALRTPEGSSGAAGANVQATDGVNVADIRLSELPDAEREALLTTLASYLDEAW